jgi:hypothetical protein
VTRRVQEQAGDMASTVHDRVSEVAEKIGETSVDSNGS